MWKRARVDIVSSEDTIKVVGTVRSLNRGGLFEVEFKVGEAGELQVALCKCSGRMRQFQIKMVAGDQVEVELSPYDLTMGRIVRRLK